MVINHLLLVNGMILQVMIPIYVGSDAKVPRRSCFSAINRDHLGFFALEPLGRRVNSLFKKKSEGQPKMESLLVGGFNPFEKY